MSMHKCLPMQHTFPEPPFAQPASHFKATSEQQLYCAIYDYTAADDDEVSFEKGMLP